MAALVAAAALMPSPPALLTMLAREPSSIQALVTAWALIRIAVVAAGVLFLGFKRRVFFDDLRDDFRALTGSAPDARGAVSRLAWVLLAAVLVVSIHQVLLAAATLAAVTQSGSLSAALGSLTRPAGVVLGGWIVLGTVFLLLGGAMDRALGASQEAPDVARRFWCGWALAAGFLQVWHLFAKISGATLIAVIILAAVSLAIRRRNRSAETDVPAPLALPVPVIGLCLVSAAWFAAAAVQPPRSFDSGLYHFSAVRWALEYPVVPGLGNLQGRLAFNNSSFLYVALCGQGPWKGLGHFLANNLLVLGLFVQIVHRVARGRGVSRVYHALLLPAVFLWAGGRYTSSPSTDAILVPLGAALAGFAIEYFERDARESDAAGRAAIVLLAAAGITVKLSFAAFGAVASLLVLADRTATAWKSRRSSLLVPIALAALLLVPWVVRGIVISGYPGYPSRLFATPVDWRVPQENAKRDARDVIAFARDPDRDSYVVIGDERWIVPWFKQLPRSGWEFGVPVFFAIAMGGVLLFGRRRDGPMRVLMIPLVSLVYWFLTAPAVRFAGSTFWVLAAMTGALVVAGSRSRGGIDVARAAGSASVAIAAVVFFRVLLTVDLHPGFPAASVPKTEPYRTRSGLILSVPEKSLCFDADLLCTPEPKPGLALREPGNLAAGFRIVTPE